MRIVVLGSGGLAKEYALWAMDCGITIDAFVNDMGVELLELCGREYPVIGFEGEAMFIVGVGKPENKAIMIGKALEAGWYPHPPIVHPTAICRSPLPVGVVVAPGCIITCDVVIGRYSTFNLNTTVGHDAYIGEYCTTNPGAQVSGNVRMGDYCEIGTGAIIRDGVTMPDRVRVGAQSAVVKTLFDAGTYVGVPAKVL